MQHLRRLSFVLAAALTLAAGAGAQPPQSSLAAQTSYTQAKRPPQAVRFIVIHVTEGSYLGTVAWPPDPRAHPSANFVGARDGRAQDLGPRHGSPGPAGN